MMISILYNVYIRSNCQAPRTHVMYTKLYVYHIHIYDVFVGYECKCLENYVCTRKLIGKGLIYMHK